MEITAIIFSMRQRKMIGTKKKKKNLGFFHQGTAHVS